MSKPFVTTGFHLQILSIGTIFLFKKREWRVEQQLIDYSKRDEPITVVCAPKIGKVFQTHKLMLREFKGDTNVIIPEGFPKI